MRARTAITLFTIGYLLVALTSSLLQGNWEFLFYASVVLILGYVVLLLDHSTKLSIGVLWCLSLWGLLHMLGGLWHIPTEWTVEIDAKPVLYSLWLLPGILKYDQLVHAYGFGICMWMAYQWARTVYPVEPRLGILILCALASLGLGALNEVIEFAATKWLPDTNVGGYDNTLWDLIFNLIGVTITGLIIRFGEPLHIKKHSASRGSGV